MDSNVIGSTACVPLLLVHPGTVTDEGPWRGSGRAQSQFSYTLSYQNTGNVSLDNVTPD